MRPLRLAALVLLVLVTLASPVRADDEVVDGTAETVDNLVRVTLVRAGGGDTVQAVHGGGTHPGCAWSVLFAPELADAPYGTSPGPKPDPDARFALLLCNGDIVRAIWVSPRDVLDVDAAALDEAARYVREVLTPAVSIGVNPATKGLVGLRSWYWVDGFSGRVAAPPITAFGLTVEVRLSTRSVTWDFGDGEAVAGDLGRPYPEESTVQHAHRRAGTYRIAAAIALVTEYRIDGGPWLTLPDLTALATAIQDVEQRQPVVTDA